MKKSNLLRCVLLAVACSCCLVVQAQQGMSGNRARVDFSVISVRPVHGSEYGAWGFSGSGFRAESTTIRDLAMAAYDLHVRYLLASVPKWAEAVQFAVDAKVDEQDEGAFQKLSMSDRNAMLQKILVDRFRFKSHWETRELPVYSLVVAKGGAKLKASSDKNADDATKAELFEGVDGHVEAHSAPIKILIRLLTSMTGRVVEDDTRLNGTYDFSLQLMKGSGFVKFADQPEPDQVQSESSLLTALEDLGLKLVSKKAPEKVLVVDSVVAPAEN